MYYTLMTRLPAYGWFRAQSAAPRQTATFPTRRQIADCVARRWGVNVSRLAPIHRGVR